MFYIMITVVVNEYSCRNVSNCMLKIDKFYLNNADQ